MGTASDRTKRAALRKTVTASRAYPAPRDQATPSGPPGTGGWTETSRRSSQILGTLPDQGDQVPRETCRRLGRSPR